MAAVAFAVPLLGREEELRQFCEQLQGPRKEELDASQRRHGIVREYWFLQKSPGGNLVIIAEEAPDLGRSMSMMARSRDPFDVWVREQIKSLIGVDLTQPLPPPPEELVHYER